MSGRYQELTISPGQNLPYCCGVFDIGDFLYTDYVDGWTDDDESYLNPIVDCSGTGLFTASFVDSEDCRVAYEYLCKKHQLLFQSPVKENKNSGNKLFLCVFLHKDRKAKGKKKPVPVTEATIPNQDNVWPMRKGEKLPRI